MNLHSSRSHPFRRVAVAAGLLAMLALAGCTKSEDRSQRSYERAQALIAEGKDVAARGELLDALKYRADMLEAWRAMAGVEERTGARTGYLRALRRIIELDPTDSSAKIRLAKLMLAGNALEAALATIDPVAQPDDAPADAIATRASILAASRDAPGAVREARRAVARDPGNADALLILAIDNINRGNNDEAITQLDRALATAPADARLGLAKARAYDRKGDLAAVEAELRRLAGASKENTEFRAQLVQVLIRARKMDEAETEMRSLADANAKDNRFGLDLTRFLLATKGADAARAELNARVAKGGEVFAYRIALADLEIAQQRPAEAEKLFAQLAAEGDASNRNTARIRLAELRAAQRDMSGAEKLIDETLAVDRRHVAALRLRGALQLDRGEADAAIATVREALNEQPRAADLLQLLGQAYERNRQTELADRQYSEALRVSDFAPAVALRYVAFLQRAENASRAEDVLMESGRRNPQNVEIISSLAQVRLSRQNWAGALEVADALARNEGTKALGEQIRSAALAAQNKPEESLTALERAREAQPESVAVAANLVRAYVSRRDFSKAEQVVDAMLVKNQTVPLLLLKGQVQADKGSPADAEKSFASAIAKDPRDAAGYIALSELRARQRDQKGALSALDAGLKELPENFTLGLARVGVLNAAGEYDRAIADSETILKNQPGSLAAVNNLVSLLLDNRADKPSLDRAQGLVEQLRGSRVPYFQDTLGWALHLRGNSAEAQPLLEQAKAQLPTIAAIRYHLAMVYRATGETAKATDELKSALELEVTDTDLRRKIQSAMN